jgi:hypothetical protein
VEKAVRDVRLQAVLLGSSMRFDKRKGIKEKKQEEGQVSFSYIERSLSIKETRSFLINDQY